MEKRRQIQTYKKCFKAKSTVGRKKRKVKKISPSFSLNDWKEDISWNNPRDSG